MCSHKGIISKVTPGVKRFVIVSSAFALLVLQGAWGESKVKDASPTIEVAPGFAQIGIKTVRMPRKPRSDLYPAKASIHEGLCAGLKSAGYQLVFGSTKKARDAADGDADLNVKQQTGMTLRAHTKRLGFNFSDDAENYSLRVSFVLTVREGKKRKEVYSAECKMWHKFAAPRAEKEHVSSGLTINMLTVDHYGEGPDSLKEAASAMPKYLLSKLPKAGKGGATAQQPPPQKPGPVAQEPDVASGSPDQVCKVSACIPYRCPEPTRMQKIAWSPDGKTILFDICARSKKDKYVGETLFAFSLSHKQIEPWFIPNMNHPAYSPKGDCVALYLASKGVFVVDCATRKQRRLVPDLAWYPAFTHDGKRVCYLSHKSGHPDVWIANADGSNQEQVTHTDHWEQSPVPSTTENLVAYWSQETHGIHVQRLDGDKAVVLRTEGNGCPAWSPDGDMISYSRQRRIWVMDKEGKKALALTAEKDSPTGWHAWSSDGAKMIYYDDGRGEFCILSLDLKLIRNRLRLR